MLTAHEKKQEIYTTVRTHLLTQMEKSKIDPAKVEEINEAKKQSGFSYIGEATCAYRGLGGKTCAIGCLIPDTLYKLVMEGNRGGTGMIMQAIGLNPLDSSMQIFLNGLQNIHDNYEPRDWRERLDAFAVYHKVA